MIRPEQIPGFAEHLGGVRAEQARIREDAFLGVGHDICGVAVKTMTVMDFVVLCRTSPIMFRVNPSLPDVAFFLWVLQPRHPKRFRTLAAWLFGRRLRRLDVPVEKLALACFDYVDNMLVDSPATSGKTSESCISFLASWCHIIMDSHKCSEEDVMSMPLPKLFQYIRAILKSANPERAESNKLVDDAMQKICDLINSGACTEDDLASGKYKVDFSS